MKLSLTIDSDNASVADDPFGETARLLGEAAVKIENGRTDGTIIDSNGNRVGEWTLEENN